MSGGTKWQYKLSIASWIDDGHGWYEAEESPVIGEFTGTQEDLMAHMPAIGSQMPAGTVMAWEFIPKD